MKSYLQFLVTPCILDFVDSGDGFLGLKYQPGTETKKITSLKQTMISLQREKINCLVLANNLAENEKL